MFRHHPVLTAVTAVYLGVVAWITLGPQPVGLVRTAGVFRLLALLRRHAATEWITYPTVEFAANALMFLPIGLFLLLLFGRRLWWFAVIMGVLLSGAIEFAQLYIPGRVSDVRDLASNGLGALLGVLLALVVTWPAAARRRRAERPRTGSIRVA